MNVVVHLAVHQQHPPVQVPAALRSGFAVPLGIVLRIFISRSVYTVS